MSKKLLMGDLPDAWKEGKARDITFCVTENCNLACKYCYMVGKNNKTKMSFETAKKAVDYILTNEEICSQDAVIWEFIGGEPFLEIDLIDKISDYIKFQLFKLNHKWFGNYRFNFSTNGLLYNTPKVQNYIKKNRNSISVGISVDGNKIKHDMQRVRPDGSGSYESVMKSVPLWLEQFPGASTKATFSHDDLPYLKDSIISLWNNGIHVVAANVVFEDVWHEGDDVLFEQQLKELSDYIIENKMWEGYSVRFLDHNIGLPLSEEEKKQNVCGTGRMLSIDCNGNFYTCIRFHEFTMDSKKCGVCIGNIEDGINFDKLRPFKALNLENISNQECINCEVASGCSWCTGYNYDASSTGTIFNRSTAICKMHKANVRAMEYFWKRYSEATRETSPREKHRMQLVADHKFMQIITSDNITPSCIYRNWNHTDNVMNEETIRKAIEFANNNDYTPIFLGNHNYDVINAYTISDSQIKEINERNVIVYDDAVVNPIISDNVILLISKNKLHVIDKLIEKLSMYTSRVNIILKDIETWSNAEIKIYDEKLTNINDLIIDLYRENKPIEVNVLTDRLNLEEICDCEAGTKSIALAPNGKFYICPAFYFNNSEDSIGDLNRGLDIKDAHLLELNYAYSCKKCDAYHCSRCKFLNKKLTNEINIPSKIQCVVSHIERNKSKELQDKLLSMQLIECDNRINEIDYLDPLEKFYKG